ncbi:MAG: Flp family type IVb pilin [Hyphomicrobiaceae bacterium]
MQKFIADEAGATVIEYGLIAAFIGLAVVVTLPLVGQSLVSMFNLVIAAL